MIYDMNKGVFFGELDDRTHGNEGGVSWGFIFNSNECILSLGNETMTKKKIKSDQVEDVQQYIQAHIKRFLDKYDRMNEIFNLQMSQDNRNRVLRADPRRNRTFLSPYKQYTLQDVWMKVSGVDQELSKVENLITGEMDIYSDPSLYLVSIKNISPMVCYYVSDNLIIIDRLRLLLENSRYIYE